MPQVPNLWCHKSQICDAKKSQICDAKKSHNPWYLQEYKNWRPYHCVCAEMESLTPVFIEGFVLIQFD